MKQFHFKVKYAKGPVEMKAVEATTLNEAWGLVAPLVVKDELELDSLYFSHESEN
jgi:hypothetical protein